MRLQLALAVSGSLLASRASAQDWLKTWLVRDQAPGEARLAGDADGDGDVDLIQGNGFPSSGNWTGFTVLLNSGDGLFSNGSTTPIPANSGQHFLYGELTGDGVLDVVVSTLGTSSYGYGFLVYPGLAGGTFGPPVHVPFPGNSFSLALGFADAGATQDVLALHYDPAIGGLTARWVLSGGGGSFTPTAGVPFVPPPYVFEATPVDANGDGIDDAAVRAGPAIALLLTVAGALTPGTSVPAVPEPPYGEAVRAGDWDGDGDGDLLLVSMPASNALDLRRLENLGGGSWVALPPQNFSSASFGHPHFADWDGDGAPDLLLRGFNWDLAPFSVYRNDGAGVFTRMYERGLLIPGVGPGAGVFDLNGDGDADFAGPKEILFGDGTCEDPLGTPGWTGSPVRDWEGDGDLDYLGSLGAVRVNDGRGEFADVQLSLPPPPPGSTFGGNSIQGDFNGDGRNDYLVPRSQGSFPPVGGTFLDMHLLVDDGDGTVSDAGLAAPAGLQMLTFGPLPFAHDFDGDGDLDVVSGLGVYDNDGTGFFTGPSNLYPDWRPAIPSDLDADGDEDFVAVHAILESAGLAVIWNQGGGTVSTQVLLTPASNIVLYRQPGVADFDDDGDPDIATDPVSNGTSIQIFLNGGGSFTAVQPFPTTGSNSYAILGGTDVDGDGLTDFVGGTADAARIHRRVAGPVLVYEPPVRYRINGFHGLFDVDTDGDDDIVGSATVFNGRFDGPSAGFVRQYGAGNPGAGGIRPVLGGRGPIRVGTTGALLVTRSVGAAPGILAIGAAESALPDFPLPGLTSYNFPWLLFLPVATTGIPGLAGDGGLEIPYGPLPPWMANSSLFYQAGFFDPASTSGIVVTNGLEVHHGQ